MISPPDQTEQGPFELLLFYRDDDSALAAVDGGIDGLIVDLEHMRKAERQVGFDTEINQHSLQTLKSLRSITDRHLLCRIDHSRPLQKEDIDQVIDAGADEIILPMVRTVEEAAAVVDWCGDVDLTIMIETPEAVAQAGELAKLDATRIYVGLNDLHILRKSPHIFAALGDGTLDNIRRDIGLAAMGYGGLTMPNLGSPLPARHLYHDMARLNCGFTFLRRSFYRDTKAGDFASAIASIRAEMARAFGRAADEQAHDYQTMIDALVEQKVLLSA